MCKAFTLLTRRPLFEPMALPERNASEVDVLLYQMISFCGEFFKEDFLRRCSGSLDYFQLDCVSLLSPFKYPSGSHSLTSLAIRSAQKIPEIRSQTIPRMHSQFRVHIEP